MIKSNRSMKSICETLALLVVILNALMLGNLDLVEGRDKGEDIILTKGKLIMRGGKGKGNLILDTGSKSHESSGHHMMPMMHIMGNHFNPYSFYPMQHHQQHPPMIIHPVYIEDHSAMHQHHQHHQPEQHHEYHEEPHHQYHHEEPHQEHHEMVHHHQPHHIEMQHHEPMGHHYEQEGHSEEGHHGGHETHPMIQFMMHGGSRLEPAYQQMATMQAYEQPIIYADQIQAHQQDPQSFLRNLQQQQQQTQSDQKAPDVESSSSTDKQIKQSSSLTEQASNNPLVAIIKPLFKRPLLVKQKKP